LSWAAQACRLSAAISGREPSSTTTTSSRVAALVNERDARRSSSSGRFLADRLLNRAAFGRQSETDLY
jgi:hypothetical protein